jgi:hypothetical protein
MKPIQKLSNSSPWRLACPFSIIPYLTYPAVVWVDNLNVRVILWSTTKKNFELDVSHAAAWRVGSPSPKALAVNFEFDAPRARAS